jgi:hypothetical protein
MVVKERNDERANELKRKRKRKRTHLNRPPF